MSRSRLLRRMHSLEGAPEMQEYLLHDVTVGEEVGAGAFGNVVRLNFGGTLCAGKRLHTILMEESTRFREKFVDECRLLKNLRHPHIVQFLGICFLPSSDLPVLVMEFLPYNLHDLLEGYPNFSLPIKLSILKDIARGLLYLHSQSPSIVHRDLSARNVLLNAALTAKIADFGMARIINPLHLSRQLTTVPGSGVYMPPETFQSEDSVLDYSSKLDIFSFGVVLLFVITHEFPKNILPATFYDKDGQFRPRNELERRQKYVEAAEQVRAEYLLVLSTLLYITPSHTYSSCISHCLHSTLFRRLWEIMIML